MSFIDAVVASVGNAGTQVAIERHPLNMATMPLRQNTLAKGNEVLIRIGLEHLKISGRKGGHILGQLLLIGLHG
jgi:hypothetical protein